ncbi:MAG: HAMP domain-containing protein [Deltaproteobacteria bacterium]|nr:HAMP domain-containing protein [Deltaproteobacteria bacterium]
MLSMTERIGLRGRLVLFVVVLVSSVLALVSSFLLTRQVRDLRELSRVHTDAIEMNLKTKGTTLARNIALSSQRAAMVRDYLFLLEIIESTVKADDEIAYGAILDRAGNTLVKADPKGLFSDPAAPVNPADPAAPVNPADPAADPADPPAPDGRSDSERQRPAVPEAGTTESRDPNVVTTSIVSRGSHAFMEVTAPIHLQDELWGTTRLGLSLFRLQRANTENEMYIQSRIRWTAVVAIVSSLVVLILGSALGTFAVGRMVIAPIAVLMDGVNAVKSGIFSHRLAIKASREFKNLAQAFNSMGEAVEQRSRAIEKVNDELVTLNRELEDRVTQRTQSLSDANSKLTSSLNELHATQRALVEASRRAGMADVATSVLHNVGNTLNSVSVSATLLAKNADQRSSADLVRLVAMLEEHRDDLPAFIESSKKGGKIIDFLRAFASNIDETNKQVSDECKDLQRHITHIRKVVADQQSNARANLDVYEELDIGEVIRDALTFQSSRIREVGVRIVESFEPVRARVDRHKVLQILSNLIKNACDAVGTKEIERKLEVCLVAIAGRRFQIRIVDNGIGISHDNLRRIFNQGFTTKPDGHGFGLHGSACQAAEMGGALAAESPGIGEGATFVLTLPLSPKNKGPSDNARIHPEDGPEAEVRP